MQKKPEIPYKQEIFRKGIHLVSLSIPVIYGFISQPVALIILSVLFFPAITIDITRHVFPSVKNFVNRYFGNMMREHELDERRFLLSGATYVLLSALLCVGIFPKIIAMMSFAIMIVSDICSALIGRRFGKHPFFDKSLEGTLAFWVSAVCVVVCIGVIAGAPGEYYCIGSLASIVGGIVEAASIRLKMDDNLSIPLSIGFSSWAMLLFTHQDVQQFFARAFT